MRSSLRQSTTSGLSSARQELTHVSAGEAISTGRTR